MNPDMDFSEALFHLKDGAKMARKGWNGKDMFVVLMPGLKLPAYSSQQPGAKVNDRTAKHIGNDTPLDSKPYFAMWIPDNKPEEISGTWQPGWLPGQADIMATDWFIVE